MTLEKLKKMLEDKVIDQKEFDSMVEKLGLSEGGNDDKGKEKKADDKADGLPANIQALIQSAVDRATNKLGNDNKALREEIEKLRREKLSDDEVKKLELDDKLKTIAAKEAEIRDKELRMFGIKGIKEMGLDDGSDTALALVDLVMADDENGITSKIASLKSLVDKSVKSQVEQRFKASGRDAVKGGNADADKGTDDKDDSVAVKLAKATAENNKATQTILNHYTGGKTE